jgi:hypothetical protein
VADILVFFWTVQQAMVLAGYMLLSCLTIDASAIEMRRRRHDGYIYDVPIVPFPTPSNKYIPPAPSSTPPSSPSNAYLPPETPPPPIKDYLPPTPPPFEPEQTTPPSKNQPPDVYLPPPSPVASDGNKLPPIPSNGPHGDEHDSPSSNRAIKRDVSHLCSPR